LASTFAELARNRLELFECRLQIIGDFFGEQVRLGQVFGIFEALVLEPEMSRFTLSRFRSS